jgi:cysteinyl-tRNA synthetase, unknown class
MTAVPRANRSRMTAKSHRVHAAAGLGQLRLALVVLLVALMALMALPLASHADRRVQLLRDVKTWHFQLQRLDHAALARSAADMIVIDTDRGPDEGGPFTRAEIAQLRQRPGQRDRLVLAYLSIGEAEEYRTYWQASWRQTRPAWMLEENCRWPSNHLVRFWDEAWQDIIYRSPSSYLDRILAAGFDGVYLDRVDVYWDIRSKFPKARGDMVQFVSALASRARSVQPDFIVIAQNAELLLSEAPYRAVVDAIAKEDLLYGMKGTGVRNAASFVAWSTGQLRLLQQAPTPKPVFVVEYLRSATAIGDARRELDGLGFRHTFATRALDGRDPTDPYVKPGDVGTPEFRARNCR